MTDDGLSEWERSLKAQIGENPARFLDREIPQIPESPTSMFRARLDGIDRLEVVGAWEAAERKLADERGREPRDHVMELLQQRREYLLEHGERPDDLRGEWPHELPDRYQPADRENPPKEVYVRTADGERVPYSRRPTRPSVGRSFSDLDATDSKVATDGGEQR